MLNIKAQIKKNWNELHLPIAVAKFLLPYIGFLNISDLWQLSTATMFQSYIYSNCLIKSTWTTRTKGKRNSGSVDATDLNFYLRIVFRLILWVCEQIKFFNPHETQERLKHSKKTPSFRSLTNYNEHYRFMITNGFWPNLGCYTPHVKLNSAWAIWEHQDKLTSLDFSLWSFLQFQVYVNKPWTIAVFKTNITHAAVDQILFTLCIRVGDFRCTAQRNAVDEVDVFLSGYLKYIYISHKQ